MSAEKEPTAAASSSRGGRTKADDLWNEGLQALVAFQHQHGHMRVPKNAVMSNGKSLYKWVNNQRTHYRHLKEGKKPALKAHRLAKLQEIGFEFVSGPGSSKPRSRPKKQKEIAVTEYDETREKAWDEKLAAVVAYQQDHGTWNVAENYRWNGRKLAKWVWDQRNANRMGKLKKHRREKLDAVGFDYGSGPKWERGPNVADDESSEEGSYDSDASESSDYDAEPLINLVRKRPASKSVDPAPTRNVHSRLAAAAATAAIRQQVDTDSPPVELSSSDLVRERERVDSAEAGTAGTAHGEEPNGGVWVPALNTLDQAAPREIVRVSKRLPKYLADQSERFVHLGVLLTLVKDLDLAGDVCVRLDDDANPSSVVLGAQGIRKAVDCLFVSLKAWCDGRCRKYNFDQLLSRGFYKWAPINVKEDLGVTLLSVSEKYSARSGLLISADADSQLVQEVGRERLRQGAAIDRLDGRICRSLADFNRIVSENKHARIILELRLYAGEISSETAKDGLVPTRDQSSKPSDTDGVLPTAYHDNAAPSTGYPGTITTLNEGKSPRGPMDVDEIAMSSSSSSEDLASLADLSSRNLTKSLTKATTPLSPMLEKNTTVSSLESPDAPSPSDSSARTPRNYASHLTADQVEKKASYDYMASIYTELVKLEFKGSLIHRKFVLGRMWDRHKSLLGPRCSDDCPCVFRMPELVETVVGDKLEQGDAKWTNPLQLGSDDMPVGLMTNFAATFLPRLKQRHPDDKPSALLLRLMKMWSTHTRKVGRHCRYGCRCGKDLKSDELADPRYSPTQSTAIPRKRPRTIDNETIVRGDTGAAGGLDRVIAGRKEYEVDFSASEPLGFYCETRLRNGDSCCEILSVYRLGQANRDCRIRPGTTVVGASLSGQTVTVSSCEDLKLVYDQAATTDRSELRIAFLNTQIHDLRAGCLDKRWATAGSWTGSFLPGWAGGASLAYASTSKRPKIAVASVNEPDEVGEDSTEDTSLLQGHTAVADPTEEWVMKVLPGQTSLRRPRKSCFSTSSTEDTARKRQVSFTESVDERRFASEGRTDEFFVHSSGASNTALPASVHSSILRCRQLSDEPDDIKLVDALVNGALDDTIELLEAGALAETTSEKTLDLMLQQVKTKRARLSSAQPDAVTSKQLQLKEILLKIFKFSFAAIQASQLDAVEDAATRQKADGRKHAKTVAEWIAGFNKDLAEMSGTKPGRQLSGTILVANLSLLHAAVLFEDLTLVIELLSLGADPMVNGISTGSPLALAISKASGVDDDGLPGKKLAVGTSLELIVASLRRAKEACAVPSCVANMAPSWDEWAEFVSYKPTKDRKPLQSALRVAIRDVPAERVIYPVRYCDIVEERRYLQSSPSTDFLVQAPKSHRSLLTFASDARPTAPRERLRHLIASGSTLDLLLALEGGIAASLPLDDPLFTLTTEVGGSEQDKLLKAELMSIYSDAAHAIHGSTMLVKWRFFEVRVEFAEDDGSFGDGLFLEGRLSVEPTSNDEKASLIEVPSDTPAIKTFHVGYNSNICSGHCLDLRLVQCIPSSDEIKVVGRAKLSLMDVRCGCPTNGDVWDDTLEFELLAGRHLVRSTRFRVFARRLDECQGKRRQLEECAQLVERMKTVVTSVKHFNGLLSDSKLHQASLSCNIRVGDRSLLHAAVLSEDLSLVTSFLELGADPMSKSSILGYPLLLATHISEGFFDRVEGAEVPIPTPDAEIVWQMIRKNERRAHRSRIDEIAETLRKALHAAKLEHTQRANDAGASRLGAAEINPHLASRWQPRSLTSDLPNAYPDSRVTATASTSNENQPPSNEAADLPSVEHHLWCLKNPRFWCYDDRRGKPCGRSEKCEIYIHWQRPLDEVREAHMNRDTDELPMLPDIYASRVKTIARSSPSGSLWYTAAYSSVTGKRVTGQEVILAEQGPTGRRNQQGIYWYPSEADATEALRKTVIAVFAARASGALPDHNREGSSSSSSSPRRFSLPDRIQPSVHEPCHRRRSYDSTGLQAPTTESKRQKPCPTSQLPSLAATWLEGTQRRCDFFSRHGNCRYVTLCKHLHVHPPVPRTLRGKIQPCNLNIHCISRQEQDGEGRIWWTSGYHKQNMIVYAEGGQYGRLNHATGVWWYPSESDAFDALRETVAVARSINSYL